MTLSNEWDITDPDDDDKVGIGGEEFRDLKKDIWERLGKDHQVQLIEDEANPECDGFHKKITMQQHASGAAVGIIRDGAAPADAGVVYIELNNDVAELFYLDENDNKVQITKNGKLGDTGIITGHAILKNDDNIADSPDDTISLYGKDADDKAELFLRDESANEFQGTSKGSLVLTNQNGETDFFKTHFRASVHSSNSQSWDEDDSGNDISIPVIEGDILRVLVLGEFHPELSGENGEVGIFDHAEFCVPYGISHNPFYTDNHMKATYYASYQNLGFMVYLRATSSGTATIRIRIQSSSTGSIFYTKNIYKIVEKIYNVSDF